MIETNKDIIDFVAGNYIALGMILGVFKIIARATKNVVDDKILTLFGEWAGALRSGKKKK